MAQTKVGGRLGWLWLLVSLMVLIGAFLLSLAFIFPDGVELTQPEQTISVVEPTPIEDGAIAVDLATVMSDPTPYFGKDIITNVRVDDIIGTRTMWVSSRDDTGLQVFGIVAWGIDLRATDFRNWQVIKVYGSVRPIQDEELKAQGIAVGGRTAYYLSTEKGFLLIKGLVPFHILPSDADLLETPTPEDELSEEYQDGTLPEEDLDNLPDENPDGSMPDRLFPGGA